MKYIFLLIVCFSSAPNSLLNEPFFQKQWSLKNTGQTFLLPNFCEENSTTFGVSVSDIQVANAWELTVTDMPINGSGIKGQGAKIFDSTRFSTCDDNIQNGNETGIDCGGPDCQACPTCTDGILNGDEIDVDCGGVDCAPCIGDTISQMEYFIDTDPGIGQATSLPITPSDSINENYTINLTALSFGIHVIYFRVRDNKGFWSFLEKRTFLVEPSENVQSNITALEYYIDEEPGIGLANSIINFNEASDIQSTFEADLTGLAIGTHQLKVRPKDEREFWGSTVSHEFEIIDCAQLITPANNAIDIAVNTDLSWTSVDGATGYRLTVGYSSSSGEVMNYVDVGNVTGYDLPVNLLDESLIFVTITAYNESDLLGGCLQFFTTKKQTNCNAPTFSAFEVVEPDTYKVVDYIQFQNIVDFSEPIILTAGNYISLLPGTHIQENSDFLAKIEDCEENSFNSPTDYSYTKFNQIEVTKTVKALDLHVFPNPFQSQMTIQYYLPTAGKLHLHLRDFLGRNLKVLVDKKEEHTGLQAVQLNSENLPTGTYFVVLNYNGEVKTQKVVLIQ